MATATNLALGESPQVRSSIPGRVRFTVAALAGDPRRAAAMAHVLRSAPGVGAVEVFPLTGSLVIYYDRNTTDAAALAATLAAAASSNLDHALPRRAPVPHTHSGDVARITIGGALLALLLMRRLLFGAGRPLLSGPAATFLTAVSLFTGYPFFRGAVRALAGRQSLDTDVLVSVATLASLFLRENIVALVVLWLLNIGEYLQELTLRRTRQAIEELLAVGEPRAWLVAGDVEVEVALERVRPGDLVAVYAGHRIPVDGEVVWGEGAVNQSPVTGEALPLYRQTGDTVFAGTVLETGALRVRATRVGMDTVVGRIIRRVQEAQETRAPIETVAERFTRRFVPFSLLVSLLVYLITRDIRRSMTMLLIACPCAAGLSTPTAVSAAIGNAARRGVLIKGGAHLEAAGHLDAVIFDKTGTLTVGRMLVTNVVALTDDVTPEEVVALAASGEIHSNHPLAQAVIRHAEERRIEIPMHEECEVVLGLGIRADLHGNHIFVGNARFMERSAVVVDAPAREWIERLTAQGETPICVAYNGRLIGLLGITDAVRPEAEDLLQTLGALGVGRVVMLTGDLPESAQVVAQQLGLREYQAQVLPDDKLAMVQRLRTEGYTVAMVGDGTNDAPALALADIGIAIGTGGSDVAVEAADIALASNDIRHIAEVILLGRQTLGVVRQNYALAIGVNAIGLVAGAFGALNPVLAAVLHNLSSIAVVANSTRLIAYRAGTGSIRPNDPD